MPCDSSYMKADGYERAMSRVACLLDELDGKPINKDHWDGYHPRVYNKPRGDNDARVAELCRRLQSVDVTRYSLEMQMWWRDHQAADKARLEREREQQKTDAEKAAALAKLTPYERRLLGVDRR